MSGPERREAGKSWPRQWAGAEEEKPGPVELDWGRDFLGAFSYLCNELFSSGQLTSLLENDTEITSKLV